MATAFEGHLLVTADPGILEWSGALEGSNVATEGQTVTGEWTMSATEFRARCYRLMDEVAETGRETVITKRGRPVARLVPYRRKPGSNHGSALQNVRRR